MLSTTTIKNAKNAQFSNYCNPSLLCYGGGLLLLLLVFNQFWKVKDERRWFIFLIVKQVQIWRIELLLTCCCRCYLLSRTSWYILSSSSCVNFPHLLFADCGRHIRVCLLCVIGKWVILSTTCERTKCNAEDFQVCVLCVVRCALCVVRCALCVSLLTPHERRRSSLNCEWLLWLCACSMCVINVCGVMRSFVWSTTYDFWVRVCCCCCCCDRRDYWKWCMCVNWCVFVGCQCCF